MPMSRITTPPSNRAALPGGCSPYGFDRLARFPAWVTTLFSRNGENKVNLKDFVADVICQVEDGLIDAINRHDRKHIPGRINPVFLKEGGSEYDWKSAVQNIEFDISVTVSETKSRELGGEAKVYVLTGSGKRSKSHEDTTTNRIKFSIPVSLPAHAVAQQDKQ
jgi:Trypsin-co-occurring domain 2